MPGSMTDDLRAKIVDVDDGRGISLRTAIDSEARLMSMSTGWLVIAPKSALQPAPCVIRIKTSSSSSSSSTTSSLGSKLGTIFFVAEVVRSVKVNPGNMFWGGRVLVPCSRYHCIIPASPLRNRLCIVLHSSPNWPPSPHCCGSRILSH